MNRAKYLVFVDMDEVILPIQHDSWSNMIIAIDTKPSIGAFVFLNPNYGSATVTHISVITIIITNRDPVLEIIESEDIENFLTQGPLFFHFHFKNNSTVFHMKTLENTFSNT